MNLITSPAIYYMPRTSHRYSMSLPYKEDRSCNYEEKDNHSGKEYYKIIIRTIKMRDKSPNECLREVGDDINYN